MAEPLEHRVSPLDGLLPWTLPGGAVLLEEMRFAQQIGIRLRSRVPAYLAGLPLPLEPNRAAIMRTVRVLWLGPDEWLVTAPEGAGAGIPTPLPPAPAPLPGPGPHLPAGPPG